MVLAWPGSGAKGKLILQVVHFGCGSAGNDDGRCDRSTLPAIRKERFGTSEELTVRMRNHLYPDANLDPRAKLPATDIFCHAIGRLEGRVLRPEPSKRNLNPAFEYSR